MTKVPESLSSLNDKIVGRPVRCCKKVLTPSSKGYAEVVFISDVHVGSPQCDIDRFERMLEYCLENKLYVMLLGDLIENAHRQSVGAGVYEQLENAQSQHERVVEYLRPLADSGLILGSLSGNHEDRTYLLSGVNIAKALCRELNIPYLGSACWNYWRVGNNSYRIYTLHGASGSRYVHTKLKALVDISHSFDADLIAMGHVHECADTAQTVQFYDASRQKVRERKKYLLITGHYLSYDGSYAQAKGMPISKMGSPKVKFYANKHDIHISW